MYGGQGSYNQGYTNQGGYGGQQGYGNQGGYGGQQGQNYNNYPNKGGYNYNQGNSGGSDCAGDCCKACAAALCCCCLCDMLTWSYNLIIFNKFFNFIHLKIFYFKIKGLALVKIYLLQNPINKTSNSLLNKKNIKSIKKFIKNTYKFHNQKLFK